MEKILLFDGNSIINRAFYGIRPLSTRDGIHTNALLGFLNILQKQIAEEKPGGIAVCFDLKDPTFRHKSYEQYKEGRRPMPEELAMQIPLLKELLDHMGIFRCELSGYEADDLLGTLSRKISEAGDECVVITGDRDSFQLVGGGTVLKYVSTRMGRTTEILYDELKISLEYGITPAQFIDVKALMGDASDNIPGVRGIGEKTAFALIVEFGSLDGVYENLDSDKIKPAARAKLAEDREIAYLSKELATIDRDAPVECDPGCFGMDGGDPSALYALLARLEMRSMITKLGLSPRNAGEQKPAERPAHNRSVFEPKLLSLEEFCGRAKALSGETGAGAAPEEKKVFFFDGKELCVFVDGEDFPRGYESALAALCASGAKLILHDSKPIYRFCLDRGIDPPKIAHDTRISAYLLNSPGELSGLCQKYLGILPGGEEQGAEILCPGLPELKSLLEAELEKDGIAKLYFEVELPLCEVLASMEGEGFLVDAGALSDFGTELTFEMGQLEKRVYTLAGHEFNLNSPKQLGAVLFDELGLQKGKKTKTGYSTSYDVLKRLAPENEIVAKILEYRTLSKLNSTYVEGLLRLVGDDGRIHSTFNQTGAITGRISSAEPNLQNIPVRSFPGSRLREMFTVPEGKRIVDADYSQIELRVLAHIAGDEMMKKAFADGEDIHTVTAARVFDVAPEQVSHYQRSFAKAVNFGIVYGISDFSLADDIGSTRAEARRIIDRYLEKYSGVKKYMADIVVKARQQGYVSTLEGRRRYLPDINSKNFNLRSGAERIALNAPIQGSAADIIKRAMVNVYRRIKREGIASRLILQVHDELLVEAPEREAEYAKALLCEEMEGAAALTVKLTAEGGAGKTWAAAKS